MGYLTNTAQGPQIYQPKFGPTYRVSFSCSIGLLSGTLLAVSTTWFFVAREDRKAATLANNTDISDGDTTIKKSEDVDSKV
jgi:hypothetical protein